MHNYDVDYYKVTILTKDQNGRPLACVHTKSNGHNLYSCALRKIQIHTWNKANSTGWERAKTPGNMLPDKDK